MGHVQHLDSAGVKIPSVSEIPGLFAKNMDGFEDWICKGLHTKEDRCCTVAKRKYYEEAANLGHDIHSLREAFLKGETFEEGVPEYHAAVFDPVAKFYKESGYSPLKIIHESENSQLAIELKMTGKEFGGTLDGAGTFSVPFWEKERKTFWSFPFNDGPEIRIRPTLQDIWIEDLKCRSKIDILSPLQLLGYAKLLKECYGIESNWGLIVRREKKLEKRPEIQLRAYYLPAYEEYWKASFLMWRFIND